MTSLFFARHALVDHDLSQPSPIRRSEQTQQGFRERTEQRGMSEAPRPKGRDFPVRSFPFILCPLTLPSRAGLAGHMSVREERPRETIP
jgi:hypothetical protein